MEPIPNYADIVNMHVVRTGLLRKEEYKAEVHMPDGIFSYMKLSVAHMSVEVLAPDTITKKDILRMAFKAFVDKYGISECKREKGNNYGDLVNRHVMRTGCLKEEIFEQNHLSNTIKIKVSDMSVTMSAPLSMPKKKLRSTALKAFIERYGVPVPVSKVSPGALEYIGASRNSVLAGANIHMNDTRFFEKKLDIIAFDTEGQKPPTIAQLCADPKHVYIFELDKHMEAVKKLLADGSVKKIVCDLAAEQAQMGPISNAFDLQDSKKKSLVTIINEKFGISMYKNKRIHFRGWSLPLSDDQIDYAAADAIWTYLCYNSAL